MAFNVVDILIRGKDETTKATKSAARGLRALTKVALNLDLAFVSAGVALGALFTSQFNKRVREAVGQLDDVASAADRIGVTTDTLQELNFAVELVGGSTRALESGLERFAARIGEAKLGTGDLRDSLKAMNVEFESQDGVVRNVDSILDDYLTKLASIDDVTVRNKRSLAAFGIQGSEIVSIVSDGAESFEAMKERGRELGVVIDETVIRDAVRMNQVLRETAQTIDSNMNQAFARLGPTVVAISEQFGDLASATADVAERFIAIEKLGLRGLDKRISDLTTELEAMAEAPLGLRLILAPFAQSVGDLRAQLIEARKRRDDLLQIDSATADQLRSQIQDVTASIVELRKAEEGVPEDFLRLGGTERLDQLLARVNDLRRALRRLAPDGDADLGGAALDKATEAARGMRREIILLAQDTDFARERLRVAFDLDDARREFVRFADTAKAATALAAARIEDLAKRQTRAVLQAAEAIRDVEIETAISMVADDDERALAVANEGLRKQLIQRITIVRGSNEKELAAWNAYLTERTRLLKESTPFDALLKSFDVDGQQLVQNTLQEFAGSFSDALGEITTGGSNAKDSLKDLGIEVLRFGQSLVTQLAVAALFKAAIQGIGEVFPSLKELGALKTPEAANLDAARASADAALENKSAAQILQSAATDIETGGVLFDRAAGLISGVIIPDTVTVRGESLERPAETIDRAADKIIDAARIFEGAGGRVPTFTVQPAGNAQADDALLIDTTGLEAASIRQLSAAELNAISADSSRDSSLTLEAALAAFFGNQALHDTVSEATTATFDAAVRAFAEAQRLGKLALEPTITVPAPPGLDFFAEKLRTTLDSFANRIEPVSAQFESTAEFLKSFELNFNPTAPPQGVGAGVLQPEFKVGLGEDDADASSKNNREAGELMETAGISMINASSRMLTSGGDMKTAAVQTAAAVIKDVANVVIRQFASTTEEVASATNLTAAGIMEAAAIKNLAAATIGAGLGAMAGAVTGASGPVSATLHSNEAVLPLSSPQAMRRVGQAIANAGGAGTGGFGGIINVYVDQGGGVTSSDDAGDEQGRAWARIVQESMRLAISQEQRTGGRLER